MAWNYFKRLVLKQFLLRKLRTIILFSLGIVILIMLYSKWKSSLRENGPLMENYARTHVPEEGERVILIKRRKTFLVVMILTAPKSKERRNAIRNTWIKSAKFKSDFTVRFIVGGKSLAQDDLEMLEVENTEYGDVLVLQDLKDGYNLLTNKVLQSFKWIERNLDCSFVFKADDDTFAKLDTIISELKSKSRSNLYWGFFRGDANVKRRGPWAEKSWVLCDHYLPYANGGGYLLSADLVGFVARNWKLLQLYNSEDVSVGTWLAPLKVHRMHDTRFNTEYRSRGCNNLHIVSHKQSIEDMYAKHEQLQLTGSLCEREIEKRKSFEYNWKVPPSQCCQRDFGIP